MKRANPRRRADEASHPTAVHYDNETAFFRAFLDPYLKYTSGLYLSNSDSHDTAIRNMLDKQIELANLPRGGRLLDIGCGWGCLLKRLTELRPDVAYTGIAPSENQLRFVREQVKADAELSLTTFEDFQPHADRRWDAVVLSGVLCHFKEKPAQLKRIRNLLADDGNLVVEDTFFLTERMHQAHGEHPKTRFVQKDIFGFAEIHAVGRHFDTVGEAGFKVTHCLENSESYRRTIAGWIERLKALDGERYPLAGDYIRYLSIAQEGWSYTIVNYLMAMKKAAVRR